MIHVCYGLRDESGKYSKFVGTSIESILENTREEVTIHLLHDSTLSNENRERFERIVYRFSQKIKFYPVEQLLPDRIESIRNFISDHFSERFSIAACYRYLIPDLLPREVERVIYLDADILVNLDLNELWKIELEGKSLAACVEKYVKDRPYIVTLFVCKNEIVAPEDYFNSGVLVMDLNRIRNSEDNFLEQCLQISKNFNGSSNLIDQDALNFYFANNYLKLPAKFNYDLRILRDDKINQIEPAIYHYIDHTLLMNIDDAFNRLWFEYFVRTPFCNPETFGNMFKAIQKFIMDYTKIWHNILRISKPNRCFLVNPNYLGIVKSFFGDIDGDVIIDSENPDAIKHTLEHMKNENRTTLIFVDPYKFPNIKSSLEALGFEEDRDFFNAQAFIDKNQDIFNSYNFVKGM